MRVVMAESMGMCFGVRDAIQMAVSTPRPTELTVLGELVHNQDVLNLVRGAGVHVAPSIDAPVTTPRVLITAHGASRTAIRGLEARGLEVQEATCPLVRHAHRMLDRLVSQGFFPVVIGKPEHAEVRGLVGDLEAYLVIEREDQIDTLQGQSRIGIVCQTTQPLDYVRWLVARIREAYPQSEVRFVDTVCQPTKDRQQAVRNLASRCEVVIVVGGRNSNNTRQLVRTCELAGARAYQVETAEDLRTEWLYGADLVGLTAGTSTPDHVIHGVHSALQRFALREAPLAA